MNIAFIILANAWRAGHDNPTSKHRIALELARRGHRVLWVEGAGMRAPRLKSGADRARIFLRMVAAARGARKIDIEVEEGSGFRVQAGAGEQGLTGSNDFIPHSDTPTLQHAIDPCLHSLSGAIWVLTPLLAPLPRYGWIRRLNGILVDWQIRRVCRMLGLKDFILINYVPVLGYAMERRKARVKSEKRKVKGEKKDGERGKREEERGQAEEIRTVYHCVDRWDAFAMYDPAIMAEADALCCRSADLVIASSRDLYERCRVLNPRTQLVSHGVDHEHFASALTLRAAGDRPGDLPPGPVIGFFGLISEWIDQTLLVELARALPACRVVLIGRADVDIGALNEISNIDLLGPRPFADLPRYAAFFDIGIIPFLVNDLTRAVNPIKLREMLAAGSPVVATALPEVKALRDELGKQGSGFGTRESITTTINNETFIEAVRELTEKPFAMAERQAVSSRIKCESWPLKVDRILNLIDAGRR